MKTGPVVQVLWREFFKELAQECIKEFLVTAASDGAAVLVEMAGEKIKDLEIQTEDGSIDE